MKRLAVLYTKHCRPLSLTAIIDVFQTVNRFYTNRGKPAFFDIQLVKAEDDNRLVKQLYEFESVGMSDVQAVDFILIPAFKDVNIAEGIQANKVFIPWLVQQYKKGAEIGSVCTGALLLASSGLLNGKRATTHVMAATAFAAVFPSVILDKDAVVTDDCGLYTSGGATSSFHLMLYLIQKYCCKEAAVYIAKQFSIDMDRVSQSHFASGVSVQQHNDALVKEAQELMEQRYRERVTIEDIVKDLPASRRNFIRRFKVATGLTPIEYLQHLRIEAAKKKLEQGGQQIAGVMLDTGYEDAKAFRQMFKRMVGLTPKEYRNKFAATYV